MSLSSLFDVVTASIQLAEAAISAAHDAAVARTLSAIHSNAALAADKLFIDLDTKIEMKNTPTIASSDVSAVTTLEGSILDVSTMTTSASKITWLMY